MTHPRPPHHKAINHYDRPGHVHELTFSCYQRVPLLTNDLWCQMLSATIDRAVERHKYGLVAFVFMPEHIHLIVHPRTSASGIAELLRAIKRPFSFRIKQRLRETNSSLLDRLTIRQRPGVTTFRFWQEGPGYDRNLTEVATTLAAIEYVHMNPVRRGLVERAIDWQWSSASWHATSRCPLNKDLPTIDSLPPGWLDQSPK